MKNIDKKNLAFATGELRKIGESYKTHSFTSMPFDMTEVSKGDSQWDDIKDFAVEWLVERGKLPSTAKPQDYERYGTTSYAPYTMLIGLANALEDQDDKKEYKIKLFDNAFDKIILPDGYKERIIEVVAQLKEGKKIFDEWGLAEKIKKGRGVNLLFSGESGTGKTYCGEIIADYIGAKSEVISVADIEDKYVGESEKNIKEMFKSLQGGNKVLVIDEADSFLLSRGESKQSYENKLTNQFLIELERHNGIVVMTTNRPVKLDKALARRIDINLDFPFPNKEARLEIWKYIVPKKMPKDNIDYAKVAEIKLNGGLIKNAILSAARKMVTHGHKKLTTDLLIEAATEELLSSENENLNKDHS